MRRFLAAFLLTVLMAPPAAAKDPVMESLSDPAKLAEVLKKSKPKTVHLEAALKDKQAEAAKLLLKAGVKIPSSDEKRRVLLDLSMNDAETVRLLLAAGVPVDVMRKDIGGMTALEYESYCENGERPDSLSALLDAGASLKRDPLTRAISRGCSQYIELLLRHGAKTTSSFDWHKLSPESAKLLLEAGYKPSTLRHSVTEFLGEADTDTIKAVISTGALAIEDAPYAYHRARRVLFELASPDLALADLILPRSNSSDFFCEEKTNLISNAALLPDPTVLRYLLKRFAKDTACVATHPTLLKLTACGGQREAVAALVAAGAKQERVLHDAIREECPLAGVKALIEAGVSLDARVPGSYRTPLETAIWHYRYDKAPSAEPSMELIEALLSEKSKVGFDSLLIALSWPQVARRLVKAGADINVLNSDGKSVLWYTIGRELELALALGANPNVEDKTGKTPLMAAAEGGRTESVAVLLKHGADPQRVEALGRTALQIARERNHLEVAQLLSRVTKVASAAPAAPAAPAARAAPAPDIRQIVKQAISEARKEDRAVPAPAPPAVAAAPASDVDNPRYSSPEDPDAYAIVVGVEEYSELPKAVFAERDAAAVRRHFKALGVPDRNLVLLSGAKAVRSSLAKYLESWLPKNVTARSMVYFYFSGHGAPDPLTGGAYLMPWDGDPSFLSDTAYPVERLYRMLGSLKAKQVVVALDACFSGAGGRSVLPEGARPLVTKLQIAPTGRLVVLSATQPDQITGVLKEQGHGLFTYHLLKGLGGAAAGPDGAVTPASLHGYLKPKVQDEARRQNRDQTPSLSGPDGVVLRRR